MPDMDTTRLKEFAALETARRELETRLKAVEERIAALKPGLINMFACDGIQNVTLNGLVVYLRRDLWARADHSDPDRLAAAFEAAGIGWMLKRQVNGQTLSAWIREQEADETGAPVLPDDLTGVIKISEMFDLRSNVAGSKRRGPRKGGSDKGAESSKASLDNPVMMGFTEDVP